MRLVCDWDAIGMQLGCNWDEIGIQVLVQAQIEKGVSALLIFPFKFSENRFLTASVTVQPASLLIVFYQPFEISA